MPKKLDCAESGREVPLNISDLSASGNDRIVQPKAISVKPKDESNGGCG